MSDSTGSDHEGSYQQRLKGTLLSASEGSAIGDEAVISPSESETGQDRRKPPTQFDGGNDNEQPGQTIVDAPEKVDSSSEEEAMDIDDFLAPSPPVMPIIVSNGAGFTPFPIDSAPETQQHSNFTSTDVPSASPFVAASTMKPEKAGNEIELVASSSVDPSQISGPTPHPSTYAEMQKSVASKAATAASKKGSTSALSSIGRPAPNSTTATKDLLQPNRSEPATARSTGAVGTDKTSRKKLVATSSTNSAAVKPTTTTKKDSSMTAASSSSSSAPSTVAAWTAMWETLKLDVFGTLQKPIEPTPKALVLLATKLSYALARFSFDAKTTAGLSTWGDESAIPPQSREEVLEKMLAVKNKAFFTAVLATPEDGVLKTLNKWLIGASAKECMKKDEILPERAGELRVTLLPILQVLDKLPLDSERIQSSAIGKRVNRIMKGLLKDPAPKDEVIRKLCESLVDKWQSIVNADIAASAKTTTTSEKKSTTPVVKRKTTDSAVVEGPAKKLKSTTTAASTTSSAAKKLAAVSTVKKVVAPTKTPAPPKSAAPAKPSAVTKPAPKPPVQPINNPLASFLSGITIKKNAVNTDIPVGGPSTSNAGSANGTTNKTASKPMIPAAKPKRTVRWKDDAELVKTEIVERLVYVNFKGDVGPDGRINQEEELADAEEEAEEQMDEDEDETSQEKLKGMEEREGNLMHHKPVYPVEPEVDEIDEQIEWYEPEAVDVPNTELFAQYHTPVVSEEAALQASRESTAVEYVYVRDARKPLEERMLSPHEPPPHIGTDEDTVDMMLVAELMNDPIVMALIANAQASNAPISGFLPQEALQSVLGSLTGLNNDLNQHYQQQPPQQHYQSFWHGDPSEAAPAPMIGAALDPQALAALSQVDPAAVQNWVQQHPTGSVSEAIEYANVAGWPPSTAQQGYAGYVPPSGPLGPQPDFSSTSQPDFSSTSGAAGRRNRKKTKGAGGGNKREEVCRHFNTRKGCYLGDSCRFAHDRNV